MATRRVLSGGSTTRELAGAELPVQIRLGSTDLYFFNAEQTESD
jgi:hypothetical protein